MVIEPHHDELPVRLASPADAESITIVINNAFRVAENFFVSRDRLDVEEVHRLLDVGKFLLIQNASSIIGCVYVEPRGDREEMPWSRAYLGLLAVDPERQLAGLGSRLMEAAEDYCCKLGCHDMEIRVVNLRHELPAYYHRRGYVETGTEEFPPEIETNVPCHFILMSKSFD